MIAAAEMLRATEAAFVASVALRDVNRAIDEHILPEGFYRIDDGRHVRVTGCTLIAFYFDTARRLTAAEERLRAIKEAGVRFEKWRTVGLAALSEKDWTIRHEFVSIDLAPFVKRTRERMDRLEAARRLVVCDPEVLGGAPVIRGTRIPVHDVAASMASGVPIGRLLGAYPSLDAEKVELARLYAEANPMRGRPRSGGTLPTGAIVVRDRRVARRRSAG